MFVDRKDGAQRKLVGAGWQVWALYQVLHDHFTHVGRGRLEGTLTITGRPLEWHELAAELGCPKAQFRRYFEDLVDREIIRQVTVDERVYYHLVGFAEEQHRMRERLLYNRRTQAGKQVKRDKSADLTDSRKSLDVDHTASSAVKEPQQLTAGKSADSRPNVKNVGNEVNDLNVGSPPASAPAAPGLSAPTASLRALAGHNGNENGDIANGAGAQRVTGAHQRERHNGNGNDSREDRHWTERSRPGAAGADAGGEGELPTPMEAAYYCNDTHSKARWVQILNWAQEVDGAAAVFLAAWDELRKDVEHGSFHIRNRAAFFTDKLERMTEKAGVVWLDELRTRRKPGRARPDNVAYLHALRN